MEELEYNVITINNIDYTEIDRIIHNNNTYVFFSNLENPEQFCIKKLELENNEEYVVGLESDEEFHTLLNLFSKKYLD